MTPPCKDCTTRAVGCHGTCPRYAAFRAERLEEYKERFFALIMYKSSPSQIKAVKRLQSLRRQNR